MKATVKRKKVYFRLVVVCCVVVLILLSSWLIGRGVQQHSDRERFSTASLSRDIAFRQVINGVGTPIREEKADVCYDSEQGPFDNGKLWCQLASVAYFSATTSDQKIEDLFTNVVKANKWPVRDQRASDFEFDGAEDLPCALYIYDGRSASDPGFYLPKAPGAAQAVILVCSDRAKARHYSYVAS